MNHWTMQNAIEEALFESQGLPIHRQAEAIHEAVCRYEMVEANPATHLFRELRARFFLMRTIPSDS